MSRRKANRKEVEELLQAAEAANWRIVNSSRHFTCYSPDGVTIVTVPQTPSDGRSLKNSRSLLRRAGVLV